MDFLEDNLARLKAARGFNPGEGTAESGVKVLTLGEALDLEVKDRIMQNKIFDGILAPVIRKLVTTTDIAQLRIASTAEVGVLANEHAPFLKLIERQPQGILRVMDYQVKLPEERIGLTEAEVWNITGALPGEAKMNRPTRYNTLTCIGNTINVALITEDMARQQANVDQLRRELQFENTRIRVKMDKVLISNAEVKFEELPNVPACGGFVTRSTLYNTGAGAGDLTRTLIQGRVDAISNIASLQGRGDDVQLVAMTNRRQLQVVRDIIIQEYNGIYPTDRLAFEEALRAQIADAGLRSVVLFESNPGRVIPFIQNSHLPSGTTIIFEAAQPQLGKMQLGGQYGPFTMLRPTERLQSLNVMFDLSTLIDPLIETRSLITNTL